MNRRASLTVLALVLTIVTMIGLVPWVLTIVSIPLFAVWVGMPIFIAATALSRLWADGGRWAAGRISERPIARPYRPVPRGTGFLGRIKILMTDPATWRDLLWILLACIPGFILVVLTLVLAVAPLFYLAYPLLLATTPPEVFSQPVGNFFTLEHWTEGFWMWPVAAVFLGLWWVAAPALMAGWAGIARALLSPTKASELGARVTELSSSRAETRDSAATELRRIERDLHDGVQVKLASLGMSLGLIEQLMETDPEKARTLLAEASSATTTTMQDLRAVVRGIHPPVLADRGLVGAVEALTLELPLPCSLIVDGFDDADARLDAPVESCLYFGIAEALANVVKHSAATRAEVVLTLGPASVVAIVTDNGVGGAEPAPGSGLLGIERRLRAFDGTLRVDSPTGGPTTLTLEMPCEHSSPRTRHSSARV